MFTCLSNKRHHSGYSTSSTPTLGPHSEPLLSYYPAPLGVWGPILRIRTPLRSAAKESVGGWLRIIFFLNLIQHNTLRTWPMTIVYKQSDQKRGWHKTWHHQIDWIANAIHSWETSPKFLNPAQLDPIFLNFFRTPFLGGEKICVGGDQLVEGQIGATRSARETFEKTKTHHCTSQPLQLKSPPLL